MNTRPDGNLFGSSNENGDWFYCGTTRLQVRQPPDKGRYFCPNCHAKEVQLFGEFVRNEVAEPVPPRHWAFSVPRMLLPDQAGGWLRALRKP